MKFLKYTGISLAVIIAISLIIMGIAFLVLKIRTKAINDDISTLKNNEKFSVPQYVANTELVTQDISCGYAVIEMFAKWNNKDITEQSLYEKYGRVVTSTGKAFANEMNIQFPEYKTKMYKYLKNSELIQKIYASLEKGIPVPFEWSAKLQDTWTLHYSLIIGLDIKNDKITILNPYGYNEILTLKDFTERTTFNAFTNMPSFYKFAFAFGIFEKNTIFIPEKII